MDAPQSEKLHATLLEGLRDAAILLDDRRSRGIVGTIDSVEAASGAHLRRMVNTFQYQQSPAGLDPQLGSRSE